MKRLNIRYQTLKERNGRVIGKINPTLGFFGRLYRR